MKYMDHLKALRAESAAETARLRDELAHLKAPRVPTLAAPREAAPADLRWSPVHFYKGARRQLAPEGTAGAADLAPGATASQVVPDAVAADVVMPSSLAEVLSAAAAVAALKYDSAATASARPSIT